MIVIGNTSLANLRICKQQVVVAAGTNYLHRSIYEGAQSEMKKIKLKYY